MTKIHYAPTRLIHYLINSPLQPVTAAITRQRQDDNWPNDRLKNTNAPRSVTTGRYSDPSTYPDLKLGPQPLVLWKQDKIGI